MFVDTHSHIDFEDFQDNFDELLQKCKEAGVEKIVIPGVEPEGYGKIISLIEKYDNLYGAIGIHPSEAKKMNDETFALIRKLASHEKVVAIGEVGLDYYWDKSFCDLQKEVFKKQIELAVELKKPLLIHDREAHKDTYDLLVSYDLSDVPVIMHCFSGSPEFALECVKKGFYIAFGGGVTFKNAIKPKETAKVVPLEKIVLETDAPYLTPHPFRGKLNAPYYIPLVAEEIASLKGITQEEVARVTTSNANQLFSF